MLRHVLAVFLPLLAWTLLLLWAGARLLGPHPRTVMGELPILEKAVSSKKRMVVLALGVGVFFSLMLLVMTLALLITWVPMWLWYVIIAIDVVGGLVMASLWVAMFVRIFQSTKGRVAAGIYALAAMVAWLVAPNWLTVNALAVVLVMTGFSAYLQFTLNFKALAVIVGGLFMYDVVNVYITGNMLKLAEAVIGTREAPSERPLPMLFIVPERLSLDTRWAGALGLGDVIVPGMLVMVAAVLAYHHQRMSVLYGALTGYAVGLALVEVILVTTRHGQPALITLYPCVMAGILLAARRAGLVRELFALRHEPPPDTKKGGQLAPASA